MTYPDNALYGLASGWNNIGGIQVLAGYQPMGVRAPFLGFIGFGLYNPGARRVMPLVDYIAGYPSVQWVFSYEDFDQLLWISNTYCNSGWTGLVTAGVTTRDQLTLEYWNAKISIPSYVDLRALRPGWGDSPMTLFKHGVAS